MNNNNKQVAERALGPLKGIFQKQLKLVGANRLVPIIQGLGFQWIPEIVLRGHIESSLITVGGSFVTVLTLLAAVQVFGTKGLVHWGMVQGGGMVAGAMVVITDSDKLQ